MRVNEICVKRIRVNQRLGVTKLIVHTQVGTQTMAHYCTHLCRDTRWMINAFEARQL
jgi:hypothetical protein